MEIKESYFASPVQCKYRLTEEAVKLGHKNLTQSIIINDKVTEHRESYGRIRRFKDRNITIKVCRIATVLHLKLYRKTNSKRLNKNEILGEFDLM